MDHRWDESLRRDHEGRDERERYGVARERDLDVERRDRIRAAERRRVSSSPWEIGSAHWDQRDLYTKNARIDDEGYGVGPRIHPELGSYAYPRDVGHPDDLPHLPPNERYAREAWPWRNYEPPPSRRNTPRVAPHHAETFFERLADKVVTALMGEPRESRIARQRGPKNWRRSDASIHDDVCVSLSRHGELDATDIEVTVKDAEVTLTGTVADKRSKRLAEDLAHAVSGVVDVHNRLELRDDDGSWLSPAKALVGVFG